MAGRDAMKKRKIAVLGSRSVGKSSMILQFTEGHFIESYHPTIENAFVKTVPHKGTDYECEIIDTAGQDEYSLLGAKQAIGIHGYVLVYSVASHKSLDMIQVIYNKIVDYCGVADIPCVIVGSKIDLKTGRQVNSDEGMRLAEANKAAWIETSAKENVNVSKVFELCLAEIEKGAPSNQPESSRQSTCLLM